MKIKKKILNHGLIIKILVAILRFYIWFVFKTSKFTLEVDDPANQVLQSKSPAILLSWHNKILIAPKVLKKFGKLYAVVSMHSDGDYLSKFIISYDHGVIRGSSKKGAVAAILGLRNALNNNHAVMITPDGPRGPKERINSNIAGIIKKFNAVVLFSSYSCSRKIICNSWDNFVIPLPFSKILFIIRSVTSDLERIDTNEDIEKYMIEKNHELDNNNFL